MLSQAAPNVLSKKPVRPCHPFLSAVESRVHIEECLVDLTYTLHVLRFCFAVVPSASASICA